MTVIYKFTRTICSLRWTYLPRFFFPIKKSTFLGLYIIRPYLRHKEKVSNKNFTFLFKQTGGEVSSIFPELRGGIGSLSKNSVAGYVPYAPNNTEIVLYNFFSVNYGIRKCLVGQISIIKNRKVVATRMFSLASRGVFSIKCAELFSEVDGDIIVVCLFHPRLPSNHGGHDGHLRFWGVYGNSAITHSLPFPEVLPSHPRERVSNRGGLGLGPYAASSMHAFSMSFYGKVREHACDFLTEPRPLGFHVLACKDTIRSVWHGSIDERVAGSPINAAQIIGIPDIDKVDVKISFFEAILVSDNCNFSLVKQNGEEIESHTVNVINSEILSASSIFVSKIQGCNLIVKMSNSAICGSGYLNLQYVIDSHICDSVHSHKLENLIDKNKLQASSLGQLDIYQPITQGLKFMPFRIAKKTKVWLMVWGCRTSHNIRIRLITASGEETVIRLFLKAGVVEHILLNEVFAQFFCTLDCWCVAQLESDFANPAASLFYYNESSQSLAVDHLTGG